MQFFQLSTIKKFGKFLFLLKLHIISIGVIALSFFPIATWYLNHKPIWGVDFFLTTTLANILKQNFVFPFEFWNYAWFGGFPVFFYPFLHIYAVGALATKLSLIQSAQIYMMAATLLFGVGAYFLFYIISRNFILSAVLAIATLYSGGVYQTLTWAGSLPSYATQSFFPWCLGFFIWYLKSGNIRYLLTTALLGGLSVWGHPLTFVVYIVPAVIILTLFNFEKGLAMVRKAKVLAVFFAISFLVGLPQFYLSLESSLKQIVAPSYKIATSTTRVPDNVIAEQEGIQNFHKAQVERIIVDNHILPFILIGLTGFFFALSVVLGKKKESLVGFLPYLFLAGYFTFYIWLFGQGVSVYHGGWYRLFWSVPIWVGAFCAACWGLLKHNTHHFLQSSVVRFAVLVVLDGVLLFASVGYFLQFTPNTTIGQIIFRGQPSSVNTDIVNLKVSDEERANLKSRLVPSWLNPDDTQYRLYDADQTVNIFWNSYFKMPLARGYLDPPSDRGFIFLLDAAMSESDSGGAQLVDSFNYPLETALSNTLFLIDWNAIKFYEGGHIGDVYKPFPKHLSGYLDKDEILDLNAEKYTKKDVSLHFYKLIDEVTSPILSGTNASTIGIFATDRGYETVVRSIAEKGNLNSQVLIPIKLGKFIDGYGLSDMKNFDALYLYDYDYKDSGKVFRLLTEYVSSGKKVFVDTGTEIKDSSNSLPGFFPPYKVVRSGLGMQWDLEFEENELTQGVEFTKFSPPVFDNADWSFSYVDGELRPNAKVILKNNGKIIAASHKIGNGEVIWSGINLSYHLTRNHNVEEAKFFNNILSVLVDSSRKPLPQSEVSFVNPNTRTIKTQGARGILFKEQFYDGWRAKVAGASILDGNLKIYKAGPAVPGYMYIPLSDSGKNTIEISFLGSLQNRLVMFFSLLVIILLIEEILFSGIVIGRSGRFVFRSFKNQINKWWRREDE